MLRSLSIENVAVIEKADIDFEDGFSVLSGETGAGKSIIIGSVGLALGGKARIGHGGQHLDHLHQNRTRVRFSVDKSSTRG